MGGKGTILLVLGFTISFLAFGRNFLNLTKRSSDNVIEYFSEARAHNIAVSAANFACSELYQDKNWTAGNRRITRACGNCIARTECALRLIVAFNRSLLTPHRTSSHSDAEDP